MGFLVNFVRVVFAPLLQPVAAEFHVTAASLGIVTAAAWLGSAAPRLPTGILLTHLDRHRVIAATGALLVLTATFTASAASVRHLVAGAFLMGLSSGMYFIAANPLVSELFPERIARVVSLHGLAILMAAVLAPLIVAGLLTFANWRLTFIGVAVAAGATTLLLTYAARWTDLPAAGLRDQSLIAAGRHEWPIILTGVAVLGAVGFLWNGLFNLYGDYLTVAKGLEAATGRLLLSVMFAAGLPAFLVAGRLGERYPTVPLLITITAGFVASVIVFTFAEGLLLIAAVSLAIGFLFYLIVPLLDTYLLASLPDHHRGSAYAIYSATMMVIQALGSGVIGSSVASGVSYGAMFRAVALTVGAVALGMAVLHWTDRLPTNAPTEGRTPP